MSGLRRDLEGPKRPQGLGEWGALSRGDLSKCLDESQRLHSCVLGWHTVAQYLESRAQLSRGSPARRLQGQGPKTGLSLLAEIIGLCMGQESFPLWVQGAGEQVTGAQDLVANLPG